MCAKTDLVKLFTENATKVGAQVHSIKNLSEAFSYVMDTCEGKEACKLLLSGCEQPLSKDAKAHCDLKQKKIIAAPEFTGEEGKELAALCEKHGFELVTEGMRQHLAGVDIGLTHCDYGMAKPGTLVLNSNSEELRLATMVSEFHIAILPVSRIREDSDAVEAEFTKMLGGTPSYNAFITGPSRTADIERVLAVGVHGPLELHILLLEEN